MKKLILSLVALVASFSAHAAGTATGVPTALASVPGAFIFYVSGGGAGHPPCAAGQPGRFAIVSSTLSGQSDIAGVRVARTLGQTITVVGTGTCSVWGDTETASVIVTN